MSAGITPFLDAGKAVLNVEYGLPRSEFCGRAADLGIVRDAQAPRARRMAESLPSLRSFFRRRYGVTT